MKNFLLSFTFLLGFGAKAAAIETPSNDSVEVQVTTVVGLTELKAQYDTPVKVLESYVGSAAGLSELYLTVGGPEEESRTWKLPIKVTEVTSITIQADPNFKNSDILTIVAFKAVINENGEIEYQKVTLNSTFTQSREKGKDDIVTIDKTLSTIIE
jgi:hypothetical protein